MHLIWKKGVMILMIKMIMMMIKYQAIIEPLLCGRHCFTSSIWIFLFSPNNLGKIEHLYSYCTDKKWVKLRHHLKHATNIELLEDYLCNHLLIIMKHSVVDFKSYSIKEFHVNHLEGKVVFSKLQELALEFCHILSDLP